MCVTSLLCGPRADLWPFYGFLCKRLSLYIHSFFIRILFSRARLNILIFPPILGCKYSCIILNDISVLEYIKVSIIVLLNIVSKFCRLKKGINWKRIFVLYLQIFTTRNYPFQNLSLEFILKVFLRFRKFQPRYSYKIYSYRKKECKGLDWSTEEGKRP